MTEKYNVYVRSSDGKHKISKRPGSLEAATKTANEWLGLNATWQGPTRAISMHGSVLTIEEAEERVTRTKSLKSLEELQDDLNNTETWSLCSDLMKTISDAESCETRADFTANMKEAIETAKKLIAELKTALS